MKNIVNTKFLAGGVLLFFGLFFLVSCKGNLKVVAHYSHPPSGNSSYYLQDGIKLELAKEGDILATQYSDGISTLDFGDFENGQYSIHATGVERRVNLTTGVSYFNQNLDKLLTFSINSPTKTANIYLP